MCLVTTKNSKILIAEKDITVWKVFEITGNNKFVSPYRYVFYKLGESFSINNPITILNKNRVYEGFHAYVSKNEALDDYPHFSILGTVLIPCKIPKGSQYIIGCFESDEKENNIVSNNIVLPKTFTYGGRTYYMNKKGELKTKTTRKRK